MSDVGKRVRLVRNELGWTQDKLASKANMSKSFLSDVERGGRDISSDYLLRLANAMGASLEFLLRGEETPLRREEISVPPALSEAAEQLGLRWDEAFELLRAHNSVIARRTGSTKTPSVEEWIELHKTLKSIYDGETGE